MRASWALELRSIYLMESCIGINVDDKPFRWDDLEIIILDIFLVTVYFWPDLLFCYDKYLFVYPITISQQINVIQNTKSSSYYKIHILGPTWTETMLRFSASIKLSRKINWGVLKAGKTNTNRPLFCSVCFCSLVSIKSNFQLKS